MATSLVNGKYRITRRIGGGSFGEIYLGIGLNNEKVAVKFERHGTRCPQLRHEYKVYRELANCHGFCFVYHFGVQDNYNVMVMDLLGPSLEDLFNKCQRRFSLKTVLQLADQMLERVDTLHSRHLIHRDIKPANFVIGLGDQSANVYCVDFGLSKRYRHPKSLQHIPHRDGRSLTGTPRYASVNNHLGIEQSRRDDLESIGYVLVYFLKGSLPWQGLKAKNAQKKYRLILEKKQQVSIAQLCQGCPSQFAEFLAYSRSLKFDAKPDIPYIRKLFRDLYHAQGCGNIPKLWDWDHIDTDYMTSGGESHGSVGGPPAIVPLNPGGAGAAGGLRPTTAAAVQNGGMLDASGGGGMPDDDMDEDFDNPGGGGAVMNPNMRQSSGLQHKERPSSSPMAGTSGLPSTSAKSNPQAQPQPLLTSWGYPRTGDPSNGMMKDPRAGGSTGLVAGEYGGGQGIADPSQKRPHTAHGGRGGAPAAAGNAVPGADIRKPGGVMAGDVMEDDGDGHVVAGARAMMRYRRTRTGASDGSDGGPGGSGSGGGGGGGGGGAAPGRGTWTGEVSGQAGHNQQQQPQMGSSRGMYSNSAAMKPASAGGNSGAAGGAAMYGMLPKGTPVPQPAQSQQYIVRDKPTSGAPGWMNAGGGDRPKSAGLMSTLTGGGGAAASATMRSGPTNAGTGMVPPSQNAANTSTNSGNNNNNNSANNNNTLSYGSLKNRFLSGSKGGTKSTKLFSLSR